MIKEPSPHLFSALEARAESALDELRHCRARLQELETRLAESEAARQELEAARLELMEENRELDEQNRELEEDNRRLRERLRKGEPAPTFPGPTRRAQGLAALMGRTREEPPRPAAEARPAEESGGNDAAIRDDAEAVAPTPTPAPASAPSSASASLWRPTTAEPAATDKAAQADTERQGALAIEQAPSADALLAQWYQRYPATFFKGHTRPLKVGIHQDLAEREPWPEKLVRRALAGYVNLPRYLKAVREGAERIDLEGKPAGEVDTQAAEHAKRKLERLQVERRRRSGAAGDSPRRANPHKGQDHKGQKEDRAVRQGKTKRREENSRRAQAKAPDNAAPESRRASAAEGQPIFSAEPTNPKERMEAKLSALLAKHNGGAKGH
ncbi:ProQ/FINO family protein [Billgrantia saliphila]|uniref:ProQ/FINO family protein n=1 Tax=Billgrantia saliphila TaxID=1848458 RepID=UPI001E53D3CC|nr:ProQ/FINO family protein [Halomonas saliphila]